MEQLRFAYLMINCALRRYRLVIDALWLVTMTAAPAVLSRSVSSD